MWKAKKGHFLGEIDIATGEGILRFKDMAKDDVDLIERMLLKRKEKGKPSEVSVKETPEDIKETKVFREVIREKEVIVKVRCPYCQNSYNEELDKCPNCGAHR